MPKPWPDDPRLDPELLASGDRRNVIDRYRYWTMEAIVADLDAQRSRLHVAIQNTISISGRWCVPPTLLMSRPFISWGGVVGIDVAQW